jgi:hypothetical protein
MGRKSYRKTRETLESLTDEQVQLGIKKLLCVHSITTAMLIIREEFDIPLPKRMRREYIHNIEDARRRLREGICELQRRCTGEDLTTRLVRKYYRSDKALRVSDLTLEDFKMYPNGFEMEERMFNTEKVVARLLKMCEDPSVGETEFFRVLYHVPLDRAIPFWDWAEVKWGRSYKT